MQGEGDEETDDSAANRADDKTNNDGRHHAGMFAFLGHFGILQSRKDKINTWNICFIPNYNLGGSMSKPTHDLCIVSGEGKTAIWTRVAALWPTKDGEGFSGEIPSGVSVSGRVVIQKRKENEAEA